MDGCMMKCFVQTRTDRWRGKGIDREIIIYEHVRKRIPIPLDLSVNE
jgi:hypothetical protein